MDYYMDLALELYPLLYHRPDDVRAYLYGTVKTLFVFTLRTALVVIGSLLLVTRLLAIVAKDLVLTDEVLQLIEPLVNVAAEFRLIEALGLLHVLTWLVVCMSSSACIYLQWTLLWRTRGTILRSGSHLRRMATVGLLVVGLVSAETFSMIVTKASVTVEQLGMCSLSKGLFDMTALFRRAQCFSSAVFTAIIVPISSRWASQLDQEQKKSITNLLSWRIFLFLHWTILIPTFVINGSVSVHLFESVLHFGSFVYRLFAITWLFPLVAYTNVPYSQEEQGIPDRNRCELVKCSHTVPVYPKKSEVATLRYHPPPPPQPREKLVIR